MKPILFTTLFIFSTFIYLQAQDIIIYNDGSEKEAKVLRVDKNKIAYKKYSNLKGPEYTENTDNIFMIKYEGGDKDVFNNPEVTKSNLKTNYTLQSGTNIEVYLTHPISSKNLRNGDIIRFAVKNSVHANNRKVIIAANTYVEGRVATSEKAKAGGVKGTLDIMISSVPAVNGRNIPVFLNVNNDGEDKEGEAFAVGMLLFWPALFMKGGEAEIEAGTSFLVQTTQDVAFDTSNLNQQVNSTPNSVYENLKKESPCGEKPIAPPKFNNPQYKQKQPYRDYRKALTEWNNCMGN